MFKKAGPGTDAIELAKMEIEKEKKIQSRKLEGINYSIDTIRDFDHSYKRLNQTRVELLKHIEDWKSNIQSYDYLGKSKKELEAYTKEKFSWEKTSQATFGFIKKVISEIENSRKK